MGTIHTRQRKDGKLSYQAQVFIRREGRIVHREVKTFARKQAASAWLEQREYDLSTPGGLNAAQAGDPTLADIIDRYVGESRKAIGKTKAQVLNSIKGFDIGRVRASKLRSDDLVAFAKLLLAERQPQTVANYMSHLGSVIAVARPAWGYPIDPTAMKGALLVTNRLGMTSKSRSRSRRPSLEELGKLMRHYQAQQARHKAVIPMTKIIPFAIFSTRRQGEIVTIKWEDLDEKHSRILVRDMKNPGEKYGNDVWCDLPPEALKVIQSMPKVADEIFPFSTDAISASFLRTCKLLSIDELTFHDLRHEGVSRLFEIGYNIPHAALVSGHRSWTSLKRYTHIRQVGDKFADWPWFPVAYGPIR